MIQKLFGSIEKVKQINGILSPKKKLSGMLNAVRSRISPSTGVVSGHFKPTFYGAFGFAGTPIAHYTLIDSEGYALIDKSGYVLKSQEGDESFWQ